MICGTLLTVFESAFALLWNGKTSPPGYWISNGQELLERQLRGKSWLVPRTAFWGTEEPHLHWRPKTPGGKFFLKTYFCIIGLPILPMFQSHLFRKINPETQITKFYISVFIVVRFFSIVRTTLSSWLKNPIWMSGLEHWKYIVVGMNAVPPVVQMGSHLSGDSVTWTISEPSGRGVVSTESQLGAWGPAISKESKLAHAECQRRNGNPLQYSFLENSINRGVWWATVHGATKSQTWLSD